MNDDCRGTQEAISRAADGERVSAAEAAHAKAHVSACAECTAFLATLTALKRTPAPAAPAATVQRAVDAVRAQAAAAAQAEAAEREAVRAREAAGAAALTAADGTDAGAAADPALAGYAGAVVTPLPRRTTSPAAVAGWIAGAAALLFVAMLVTVQGLRYIGNTGSTADTGTIAYTDTAAAPEGESSEQRLAAEAGAQAGSEEPAKASAARYVEFEGFAYRYLGTVDVDPRDLPPLGSTYSALDSGDGPTEHAVYRGDATDRIVVDNEGAALSFQLVSRPYDGATYALATAAIDAFGVWPTLPDGVPEPSDPDGSPAFVEAGEQDGVTIYAPAGKAPERGFAIAPGTPPPDPAAGNPGWTWWENGP